MPELIARQSLAKCLTVGGPALDAGEAAPACDVRETTGQPLTKSTYG